MRLADRVYADFLLPDRLPLYRDLLAGALAAGYAIDSISGWRQRSQSGRQTPTIILRHDVDTDVGTATRKLAIERSLGVVATYFFRLSTASVELMRDADAAGFEVGYHFEELATVAKRHRLRRPEQVERHLPEIQEEFRANLLALRATTGLALRVVAAHGDAVNRRLGIRNQALLTPELRRELEIDLEANDPHFVRTVTTRITDAQHPEYWRPHPPDVAIARGDPVIYLLTHPRQWRRNVRENMRDDLKRAGEGLSNRLWPLTD